MGFGILLYLYMKSNSLLFFLFFFFKLLLQIEVNQTLLTSGTASFPTEIAGNSGLFRLFELYS